jgi:hypothetical protein
MLLVIAVVGTVAFVIVIVLLYRSRAKKSSWTPKRFHLLPPRRRIHKVKRADRTSTWSIDPSDESAGFIIVDQKDVEYAKGHYRLQSTDPFLPLNENGKMDVEEPESDYASGPTTRWNFSAAVRGFSRFSNKVVSMFKPRSRSNMYKIDVFSPTSSQPRPSDLSTSDLRAGRYTQPVPDNHLEDESTSLISPPGQDNTPVLLITHYPGVDFRSDASHQEQESHQIDVVPATPTTESGHPLTPPVTPPPRPVSGPTHLCM